MALNPGTTQPLSGYVTIAKYCLGRSVGELDQILGYNDGALAGGYWFCLLAETVAPDEFAYRGLTHFSGGKPKGQSQTTHDALEEGLSRHPSDAGRFDKMRKTTAETVFKGTGADRIAKIVPLNRPDAYPPGKGVPQYELLVEKDFEIVAEVGPREAMFRRPDGVFEARSVRG